MSDYDARAQQYGFADKDLILTTVTSAPTVVLLDVRTPAETAETGPLVVANSGAVGVASSCTPDAAPELEEKAEEMMPDKNGT